MQRGVTQAGFSLVEVLLAVGLLAGALIDLSRLEEARRQLPDVLAQAAEAGLRVRVRAAIELEVVDEAPPR